MFKLISLIIINNFMFHILNFLKLILSFFGKFFSYIKRLSFYHFLFPISINYRNLLSLTPIVDDKKPLFIKNCYNFITDNPILSTTVVVLGVSVLTYIIFNKSLDLNQDSSGSAQDLIQSPQVVTSLTALTSLVLNFIFGLTNKSEDTIVFPLKEVDVKKPLSEYEKLLPISQRKVLKKFIDSLNGCKFKNSNQTEIADFIEKNLQSIFSKSLKDLSTSELFLQALAFRLGLSVLPSLNNTLPDNTLPVAAALQNFLDVSEKIIPLSQVISSRIMVSSALSNAPLLTSEALQEINSVLSGLSVNERTQLVCLVAETLKVGHIQFPLNLDTLWLFQIIYIQRKTISDSLLGTNAYYYRNIAQAAAAESNILREKDYFNPDNAEYIMNSIAFIHSLINNVLATLPNGEQNPSFHLQKAVLINGIKKSFPTNIAYRSTDEIILDYLNTRVDQTLYSSVSSEFYFFDNFCITETELFFLNILITFLTSFINYYFLKRKYYF